MMNDVCPFCDSRVVVPQSLITNDLTYVLYNYQPFNRGHVMVIPKKHADNIRGLTDQEFVEMFLVMRDVSTRMHDYLNADGYTYQINEGKCAGQEVFHVHFHFIPRYKNDWFDKRSRKQLKNLNIPKLRGLDKKVLTFRKMLGVEELQDSSCIDKLLLYERGDVAVSLSEKPWNKAHCYVAPSIPVNTIRECSDKLLNDIALEVKKMSCVIMDVMNFSGVNYKIVEGYGQSFRVEVIPRCEDDVFNRYRRKHPLEIDLPILKGKDLFEHVAEFKRLF